jgi:hypothetical protein
MDSLLEGDGFEPSVPRSPVAPACEGAGAVQRDFFCSASHSMEPIAHVIWVGCGLSRPNGIGRRTGSGHPAAEALALNLS